jgi:hypothetical protein
MILSRVKNDLFHVLLARLKRSDGTHVRLFGNGPHVIAYLHANPDTDFLLETVQTGQQLPRPGKAKCGPASGDVFCGRVRFDSAANAVLFS